MRRGGEQRQDDGDRERRSDRSAAFAGADVSGARHRRASLPAACPLDNVAGVDGTQTAGERARLLVRAEGRIDVAGRILAHERGTCARALAHEVAEPTKLDVA